MLTGDAASLIDPFTGEGIGNALVSGMFAAETSLQCLEQKEFSSDFINQYDKAVYERLWSELNLSRRMQQMVNYPWLFNLVVNKANSNKMQFNEVVTIDTCHPGIVRAQSCTVMPRLHPNKMLRETISCMFEDLDLRARLKQPSFYLKLMID